MKFNEGINQRNGIDAQAFIGLCQGLAGLPFAIFSGLSLKL